MENAVNVISMDQPWAQFLFIRQPCDCTGLGNLSLSPHEQWCAAFGACPTSLTDFITVIDLPKLQCVGFNCDWSAPVDGPRHKLLDLTGQRIAIASTDAEPRLGWLGLNDGSGIVKVGDGGYEFMRPDLGSIPLPRNVIVGSAEVAAVYPIIEARTAASGVVYPNAVFHWGDELRIETADVSLDISDLLPYADWTPGHWAIQLDKAQTCREKCPICPPGRCNEVSHLDPIPYTAPAGWSEWTP